MRTLTVGQHDVTADIVRELEYQLEHVVPWCNHLSSGRGYVSTCAHCALQEALDGLSNDSARVSGEPVPCHSRRVS